MSKNLPNKNKLVIRGFSPVNALLAFILERSPAARSALNLQENFGNLVVLTADPAEGATKALEMTPASMRTMEANTDVIFLYTADKWSAKKLTEDDHTHLEDLVQNNRARSAVDLFVQIGQQDIPFLEQLAEAVTGKPSNRPDERYQVPMSVLTYLDFRDGPATSPEHLEAQAVLRRHRHTHMHLKTAMDFLPRTLKQYGEKFLPEDKPKDWKEASSYIADLYYYTLSCVFDVLLEKFADGTTENLVNSPHLIVPTLYANLDAYEASRLAKRILEQTFSHHSQTLAVLMEDLNRAALDKDTETFARKTTRNGEDATEFIWVKHPDALAAIAARAFIYQDYFKDSNFSPEKLPRILVMQELGDGLFMLHDEKHVKRESKELPEFALKTRVREIMTHPALTDAERGQLINNEALLKSEGAPLYREADNLRSSIIYTLDGGGKVGNAYGFQREYGMTRPLPLKSKELRALAAPK